MLSELQSLQSDNVSIDGVDISVSVDARVENEGQLIRRTYIFGYAKEWNKWILEEFVEKRTDNSLGVREYDWTETEHRYWHERSSVGEIDIPPSVTSALEEATAAEEIVLQ